MDCGLNGECAGGVCACDRGWRGDVCGELDLRPADRARRGLAVPGTSTWGGTPVRDGGGGVHLFAERMANGCGLSTWANNSAIVHLLRPFHHNVGAARLANGTKPTEDGMHATDRPTMPPGCTGMTPVPPWMPYKSLSLDGRIRLAHAPHPDGPWTELPLPVLQPQFYGWDPFTTNAAPALTAGGGVLLVYIKGCGKLPGSWEGPYERISRDGPIFPDHSEDPFIYKGRHVVMHHLPPSPQRPASFPFNRSVWACGYACVGHAYAEHPTGPWRYSPVPAANNTVSWTDGTSEVLRSRERAQVLTNAEGDVEVLYNGVCCQADGRSTYTLAVPTAAYTDG
eukprot:gene21220-39038_t